MNTQCCAPISLVWIKRCPQVHVNCSLILAHCTLGLVTHKLKQLYIAHVLNHRLRFVTETSYVTMTRQRWSGRVLVCLWISKELRSWAPIGPPRVREQFLEQDLGEAPNSVPAHSNVVRRAVSLAPSGPLCRSEGHLHSQMRRSSGSGRVRKEA